MRDMASPEVDHVSPWCICLGWTKGKRYFGGAQQVPPAKMIHR